MQDFIMRREALRSASFNSVKRLFILFYRKKSKKYSNFLSPTMNRVREGMTHDKVLFKNPFFFFFLTTKNPKKTYCVRFKLVNMRFISFVRVFTKISVVDD